MREWARRAVALFRKYSAAAIVAESNLAGPMIRQNVRAVLLEEAMAAGRRQPDHVEVLLVPVRGEKVQRSSATRQLYPHTVSHVGAHTRLEDTMTTHDYATSKRSPGDLDALSLGCSHLVLVPREVTADVTEEYYDL